MTARARDHDAIVRVVQLYVDGFNDNDIAKFFRRFQASLSKHGIGELLVPRSGLSADLTSRVYGVLGLDRVGNVRNGDAELCQLVRLHPQSHRILTRAEDLGLAHAIQASDRIVELM